MAFARQIGYSCAGTVEFLVDKHGNHVFIEMNPRIQVEHTVTEEITDVDLVQAQLRVAAGETLADIGLAQDNIAIRGAALQCRITTEDPANGFRPDTGRITAYRTAEGAGIRLDGGTALGAEVSAYFDSMLVKLTCRGRTFPAAVARAQRAVAEFRIRGVATNLPFLQAVLADPDFRAGHVTTSFIEERPQLLTSHTSGDRGTKILTYLADVTVNKPHGPRPSAVYPNDKLPDIDLSTPPPSGSRQRLLELGPHGFAAALRAQKALAVTDTTFRDAHQSLLATRVRTSGLLGVAGHVARLTPQLLSIEAWGGATYDVALRFLHEDPWERLAALREAVPNICLQMLLRGRNTVGYTAYPDSVARAFVAEAANTGIDIFRIFDALNNIDAMRPAIDAVRDTGNGGCRSRAVLHRGPVEPERNPLHPRLLPEIGGTGRRRRRAHPGDQGHGRVVAGPGGGDVGHRAAEQLRSAGARAHPRHSRWSVGDLRGGVAGRRRRRRRSIGGDGGHHESAGALGDRRRRGLHRARHRAESGERVRPRAVLGGAAKGVRAVRIRTARTHRPRLYPRNPRRTAVESAAAGHRTGPGGPIRGHREGLRRRRSSARPADQGDAVVEGRRRPRAAPCRRRSLRRGIRRRPRPIRYSRLGDRFPARGPRHTGRWLARTAAGEGPCRARQLKSGGRVVGAGRESARR